MPIIPFLFIVFFGSALVWAILASFVQGSKFYRITTSGINGSERLITLTYLLVCAINAWFMHLMLISSLGILVAGEAKFKPDESYLDIYLLVGLLVGSIGSISVSWLILSKQTFTLLNKINRLDTDGHQFNLAKKNQNLRLIFCKN